MMNDSTGLLLGCLLLAWTGVGSAAEGAPRATGERTKGLWGEYGFLSSAVLGPQPEVEIRERIAVMARDYGIREFLFYDWFSDYSTPVRGTNWTDAFFHRDPISLETLRASIAEVHRHGGRAWAYVQAVGAEEFNLEDPAADLWALRLATGAQYVHPPNEHARFPTYLANAAWARRMCARWAPAVKELGFDGIHWDTLGRLAGDERAEAAALHAFVRTAGERLRVHGLWQTMNLVDMAWWDLELVRDHLEFPYMEAWSTATAERYFAEMDRPELGGARGVLAMYPSVAVPEGWTAADVIRARQEQAHRHRLVYLVVGDGPRRMKNEYWPDTVPLSAEEKAILRVPDGVTR